MSRSVRPRSRRRRSSRSRTSLGDRRVERRRRLVGEQEPRARGEDRREVGPLPQASREPVRVRVEPAVGIGKGDLGERRAGRLASARHGRRVRALRAGSTPRSGRRSCCTGSSAEAGSWKTRPISRPRSSRQPPLVELEQRPAGVERRARRPARPPARARAAPARAASCRCRSPRRRPPTRPGRARS